ncbi:O-antigen ligase family protein [Fodinibius sp. AD559]|uniref:O-antigen ligase family protein n=1 Tax=Fodinibius sp. AD559 TaxID=3424179 RepID=UPI004046F2DE
MHRIFFIVLLSVCVILPVVYFTDIMFLYNEKRIIQSGLLILAGIVALFSSTQKISRFVSYLPAYFWWGILISLVILIISIIKAPFPFYSVVEISLFMLLLWTAMITAHVTQNNNFGKYAVIASACFLVFFYSLKFGLGYTFYLLEFKDFPLWPASGLKTGIIGFANIRFFNQVQAFTLPLLIGGAAIAFSKQKIAGYFLLFLAAIWWMLLLQSAGRGIILSVLIAALVVLVFFKKDTHKWAWYFLGTLAVGYIAKVLLFEIITDLEQTKSILRGGSGRLTLWPKLFLASLEKPIFGHGPMSFASINTDYSRGHPHNSLLQLLYEFGYPVTITIVGGVFYGLKKWIDQTKEQFEIIKEDFAEEVVIRISLTAALFGGLIYSLLSGVIVMPMSQLWLALVFGTMLGLYVENDSKEKKLASIKLYKVICFKLLLLIASITLASVLIKDLPHLRENEKKFVKETNRNVFRPRFWQQGKIGVDQMPKIEKKSNTESNL